MYFEKEKNLSTTDITLNYIEYKNQEFEECQKTQLIECCKIVLI